ncbi:MAG: LUD domain-containing protein [Lachnospiraceae bacterium]|nr:LUD domain-containing protein [Lachnospiraceae bacterium]
MDYQTLKKNFENHRFKTAYFATKEEAADYLVKTVRGEVVGFGGSMSAKEMGLYERLSETNTVLWHWMGPAQETRFLARDATVYILSANGASETGELVNIDGTGNRLAASLFGPKRTIYLIGKNKIEPDIAAAMKRARNVAAVKNAERFRTKTPCVASGGEKCFDCNSPERICNATVILERPMKGMETELLFIDEELGF